MRSNREDLSASITETNKDVEPQPGFSYEEMKRDLWSDIDSYLNSTPERQQGDIDANQMVEHLKELGGACSSDYARKKMINMAATGKWKYIDVYDPAIKNIRKVIRPVK